MMISIFFNDTSEQANSSFLHTIINANKTGEAAFKLDLNPLLNLTHSNFMDYWAYFGNISTELYIYIYFFFFTKKGQIQNLIAQKHMFGI